MLDQIAEPLSRAVRGAYELAGPAGQRAKNALHGVCPYDPGEITGFLLLRRYRAGGTPNRRLKARLNAASDS